MKHVQTVQEAAKDVIELLECYELTPAQKAEIGFQLQITAMALIAREEVINQIEVEA